MPASPTFVRSSRTVPCVFTAPSQRSLVDFEATVAFLTVTAAFHELNHVIVVSA